MTLTPAERAEAAQQVWGTDGGDYDVIKSADWPADALLRHLDHGLSYYDEEFFFYFWGHTDRQKANLQRIVIASSPAGTTDYQAVRPAGGATGFCPRHPDGTISLVPADICWFTPDEVRFHDWVALVPKGFDLDAEPPLAPVRYFVSSTDTQILFLGLFALVSSTSTSSNGHSSSAIDGQPEIYQWNFPGWSRSHWSLEGLTDRSDAYLSEHTAQIVDECYPGATGIRPGAEVSE